MNKLLSTAQVVAMRNTLLVLLSIAIQTSFVWAQEAKFEAVFADNMVIQRDQPLSVWGTGKPDETLVVTIGDIAGDTRTDLSGKWMLTFPANDLSETFSMSVLNAQGKGQVLSNVVYGDVWLCSGQSNMDLSVRKAAYPDRTAKEAEQFDIRIMKVARRSSPFKTDVLQTDIPWSMPSEQSIPEFSAICWEMAIEIQHKTQRSMGLIQASWGGTTIEDWISADGLRQSGEDKDLLTLLSLYADKPEQGIAQVLAASKTWAQKNDQGINAENPWYVADLPDLDWAEIPMPQYWERSNIHELANFNGVIWFRKTFDVPKKLVGQDLELRLGRVNERDTVWLNGKYIADTLDASTDRIYKIPANILQAGTNTLAIRIVDERGSGGFNAHPGRFGLRWNNKELISLQGLWKYKISAPLEGIDHPPVVPWSAPRGYTTLYNGMIAPLGAFTLKGVAWYQGESNTGYDSRYAKLLPALIEDWRKQFTSPNLAFVLAQLPGFGHYQTGPNPSRWAALRGVQQDSAAKDLHTGLAILIDRGLTNDIHPSHKKEPGRRMAMEALRVAYQDSTQPQALYPSTIIRDGKDIVIEYNDPDLLVYGGVAVIGFQLCSASQDCVFKDGRVEGEHIRLRDVDKSVKSIRYAWEDSPIVNLYGQGELPAAPFNLSVQ
ncbi:sialate O-acetylesterase [Paraglaciecola sp.]|uniref:sialate O-acetylesterase n=1 Tax=Paraglaciecola sp. TaxID=1920173 RepID=UPI0030F48D31